LNVIETPARGIPTCWRKLSQSNAHVRIDNINGGQGHGIARRLTADLMRKVPQDLLALPIALFDLNGAIFALEIGTVYKSAP
jgi:hypothetical protein